MSKSSIHGCGGIGRSWLQAQSPLSVEDLSVRYSTSRGIAAALDSVSLTVEDKANLGLVGESGCGKSTFLKAVMGVLPDNAEVTSGAVAFEGLNLIGADEEVLRQRRWAGISMITQSALNSLDPVHRVRDQIVDAILAREKMRRPLAVARAKELLVLVGVDPKRFGEYPHQFSGGMRQRAIIAMALVLSPRVVLADEPTTSLDVIVQDQIFRRLVELQAELGFSMLLVTYDLALVVENCQRIAVMYTGVIVEEGPTDVVVSRPFHPYALGLKNSLPDLNRRSEPIAIPGTLPDLVFPPDGCRFAARCPFAVEICRSDRPQLAPVGAGHRAACHQIDDIPGLRAQAALPETWAEVGKALEMPD